MRTLSLTFLVLGAAACSDREQSPIAPDQQLTPSDLAPMQAAASGRGIEGSYIVVLKDGATSKSVLAVMGIDPRFEYDVATLNGFAAELNEGQLTALRRNPAVAYVEEDQIIEPIATQSNATWGLDRIDQRSRPLNGTYVYNRTGAGVYAYVIDSGILTAHNQFGGRAANVWDGTGGNGQDCNGHGTHVAGTIGGSVHGVAKQVRLRGVRVFGCTGGSSNSLIISAVDWVRQNRVNPAVANMSIGGGVSSALNTAVNNLAASGVFVAVAAGNENQNACNVSPASASGVYTVASSTSTDAKSSFSNYGSCVNIYAPGSSITSAWYTSTSATNTISGTSMASPHVAGLAALIKETNTTASHSAIATWMTDNATTNVISGNVTGTPNRLLFKSTW
ncbi:MAG: S8 family peptidase [Gemmatimonadetes bacterium]|nr:S8 family peptidase [Gemmatimonadota bacterium]